MGIQISNLNKQYGKFVAVDGVSFGVNDGEFVTLLGPSGSGKSTILRCIAGLESIDSGTIQVNDEDVSSIPVQERKVGFVFQHYALFRNMNVVDNVAFGMRVRGVSVEERTQKARELIKLVGLGGMENRKPTQLSGGQRQRVALARALAPQPKLLLLDEPFGALDTKLRKELRIWLKALHARIKLTTIMVTHDQDEAFELSDKIIVMSEGRVEQEGQPSDIFVKPATKFVASFIGESNHIDTNVRKGEISWGPLFFEETRLPDGIPVTIHFRPTDVYVSSTKEGIAGRATAGKIVYKQFMGASEYIHIEVDLNHVVIAQVPKGVSDESQFNIGKDVWIKVTQSHIYYSLNSV